MTASAKLHPLLEGLHKNDYDVVTMDDEIRVDQLSVDLLRHLYQELTQTAGIPPEMAGQHCHGADYFLREFIIPERHGNLFNVKASDLLQFAGHWYIIRTPEPNLTELKNILDGTAEFYRFLHKQKLVEKDVAEEITQQSKNLDFYQRRIDDFWAIEEDGYDAWKKACPL